MSSGSSRASSSKRAFASSQRSAKVAVCAELPEGTVHHPVRRTVLRRRCQALIDDVANLLYAMERRESSDLRRAERRIELRDQCPHHALAEMFDSEPENTILVKLAYWFAL